MIADAQPANAVRPPTKVYMKPMGRLSGATLTAAEPQPADAVRPPTSTPMKPIQQVSGATLMAAKAQQAKAAKAPDHGVYEAHSTHVGGHPFSMAADAQPADAAMAPDHRGVEAQPSDVGGHPSTRMTKMTKLSEGLGAKAQLYTTGVECLRSAQLSADKAMPSFVATLRENTALFTALAHDYLIRIAADMRNATRTATDKVATALDQAPDEAQGANVGGHSHTVVEASPADAATALDHGLVEAHSTHVGGHPSAAVKAQPAKAAMALDQNPTEAQVGGVGGHLKKPRNRSGPIRQNPLVPTRQQLAAEQALTRTTTLFDSWKVRDGRRMRKIGDLSVYELLVLAEQSALQGVQYIQKGRVDLIDGVTLKMIANHVRASDPNARVRDVVNEITLKRLGEKAVKLADKGIRRVIKRTPREILAEAGGNIEYQD